MAASSNADKLTWWPIFNSYHRQISHELLPIESAIVYLYMYIEFNCDVIIYTALLGHLFTIGPQNLIRKKKVSDLVSSTKLSHLRQYNLCSYESSLWAISKIASDLLAIENACLYWNTIYQFLRISKSIVVPSDELSKWAATLVISLYHFMFFNQKLLAK